MREDLLHFIWKYKKLQFRDLVASTGEKIQVLDVGSHNHLAGPDFFNAKVQVEDQLWAGNIEIHLKSSDWYVHNHERDSKYNNVILHVVWEDDGKVFRSDNSEIPTLQLKDYISDDILNRYQNLFDKNRKTFINCENEIAEIDAFTLENWMERLYFERLEQKSTLVFKLLKQSKNDWEQVLFTLLLKNFGLKINAEAFLSLANVLNFSTLRKLQANILQLESVLFGMSHLLEDDGIIDEYYIHLKKEFKYQKNKYDLVIEAVLKPEFFKLRPPNFPTIRLSQLANLYAIHRGLFHKIIAAESVEQLHLIFDISASPYWDDHFTFGKVSKKSKKKLSKKFIDLLVINTVLPLKFCYAKHTGKEVNLEIKTIIKAIKKEENSIINKFKEHGVLTKNARGSQAMLQLYNEYCTKNKCLRCAVGNKLIGG